MGQTYLRHITGRSQTRSAAVPTLSLIRPSMEQFRHSLYYSGVNDWNALSLELKQSLSLQSFKTNLKRQMMAIYDPVTVSN